MKIAPALALATILASFSAAHDVQADELVQVAAQRAGLPAERNNTPPLFGYLARPSDEGRHPAVVILHVCLGFTPHDAATSAKLASWGYVALALDSLSNRNVCETGLLATMGGAAEVRDAYIALSYLSAQSFVDPQRVAVMGYSMGGDATLSAIERGPIEQKQAEHFRAAIAFYPWCASSNGVMTAPTLVLIGDRDDWTPAEACRKLAAHEDDMGIVRPREGSAPVKLVIYPGASHLFDQQGWPSEYLGHTLEYNANAAKDADDQVRSFLHDELGDSTESR